MYRFAFLIFTICFWFQCYGQAGLSNPSKPASYVQLMWVFNGMQSDSGMLNKHNYQYVNATVITSPNDTIEQNLQTINNLYLQYFLAPADSINQNGTLMAASDLNTLYNIASQCHLSGGPAVFLARSMYWMAVRDNSIQFSDDCTSNTNGDKVRREQQSQVVDTIRWIQLSPCPDTNQIIASGYFLIDSDFYVAGGSKHDAFVYSSTVWRYHIPTDTWYQMHNLPFGPASGTCSFALNEKGYFLPGYDSISNGVCDRTLWQYDPINDTWARKADFPDTPRQDNSTFLYNNMAYVGQTSGCSNDDSHFWRYDPTLNQWTQIATLPANPILSNGSIASDVTSTYADLFAGADRNGLFHNSIWQYDIATNTWYNIGQMPGKGRQYPVLWKFDSVIVEGGGQVEDTAGNIALGNDFYKYNFTSESWSSVAFENSFDSTAAGAAFVYNKKGYYFGGQNSYFQNTFSNKLWSFDASKYFTDSTHVGIQQISDPYLFKVYPNPMSEKTSLNVQCSESGEIVLYNLLGQVTYQSKIKAGVNTFDCLQLSCNENVILYHATMRSGKIETGKIVTLR